MTENDRKDALIAELVAALKKARQALDGIDDVELIIEIRHALSKAGAMP